MTRFSEISFCSFHLLIVRASQESYVIRCTVWNKISTKFQEWKNSLLPGRPYNLKLTGKNSYFSKRRQIFLHHKSFRNNHLIFLSFVVVWVYSYIFFFVYLCHLSLCVLIFYTMSTYCQPLGYRIASLFQCHYHISLVVYQDTFIQYLSAADFDLWNSKSSWNRPYLQQF